MKKSHPAEDGIGIFVPAKGTLLFTSLKLHHVIEQMPETLSSLRANNLPAFPLHLFYTPMCMARENFEVKRSVLIIQIHSKDARYDSHNCDAEGSSGNEKLKLQFDEQSTQSHHKHLSGVL